MNAPDVTSSSLWHGLLPHGVAAYETRRFDHAPFLFPQERLAVRDAVPKRVEEFAAGRVCARRALADLGFESAPLLRGTGRIPLWPDGVAGSITHTDGYCAAVAARRREVLGIGIDAEIVGRLDGDMQRLVCTPEELRRLAAVDDAERRETATIIFSAKEAFFKCQSSAGGNLPDFQDLELHVGNGAFVVEPRRHFAVSSAVPLRGRYETGGGMVFTAIALAAN